LSHLSSTIIIFSSAADGEEVSCELPATAVEALNSFIGHYGENAPEVARHFICGRVGVDVTPDPVTETPVDDAPPELPEQAAGVAEETLADQPGVEVDLEAASEEMSGAPPTDDQK